MSQTTVCALYKFVRLENYLELRAPLTFFMESHQVKGTLLLAQEGINGTIAGSAKSIKAVLDYLQKDDRLKDIVYKLSYNDENPFQRTKVKLKREIVTMGVEGIDPNHVVGTYVKPQDWNDLISDPEVFMVDTRNDYEIEIGTFKHAVDPETKTFKEFPEYVASNLDKTKHKKVAMFCTGGIRCEKSTAYLKEQGFDEVYHLEGGILKYLEDVPKEESLWEGECFVFDGRVAVDHDLNQGSYDQCYACRMPITEEEKQADTYIKGVSCPKCHAQMSDEQRARFAERQRQMELANKRGDTHIGGEVKDIIVERRELKKQKREAEQAKQKT